MRIRCGNKLKRGATLAEVVMAVAILGIMAAGIIGSYSYGFFSLDLLRQNQRATQIALEKLETLRLYSWDQVNSNGFIPSTFTAKYDPQASTNRQGITYYGTIRVSPVPFNTSYSDNMRQVTVNLTWMTDGKVHHSRSIVTQIAKDGIQNYVY